VKDTLGCHKGREAASVVATHVFRVRHVMYFMCEPSTIHSIRSQTLLPPPAQMERLFATNDTLIIILTGITKLMIK
jgi:hypothetical protein